MSRILAATAALALACAIPPVHAGMLDRDTPECALAREEPTDGNIEACIRMPVSLAPAGTPAYAFLATAYTEDGPVIYVLDDRISGEDCLARMETGLTGADVRAILTDKVQPAGEGHVPEPEFVPNFDELITSCEFAWDE